VSLILDALSRAERDRRRGEVPATDLLVEHSPVARDVAPRVPRLVPVTVLFLIVAGIAVWLLTRTGPADRMASVAAVESGRAERSVALTPEPSSGDAAAPETTATRVEQRERDPRELPGNTARVQPPPVAVPAGETISQAEIAGLYEQRDSDVAVADSSAAGDTSASPAAPLPGARATGAALAPRQGEAMAGEQDDESVEEPVDLEQVLRQARAEVAASRLTDHPAPLLETLSKQYRDRVPTLMYLRHDYNPAGVSSVLLNGETLPVGGRSRGVEVREILPDSVILRFEDREFRLRALNSWVNL